MGTHRRSLTWDDWDDWDHPTSTTKLAAFIVHIFIIFNQTLQLNGTENTNLKWENPWENTWKVHGTNQDSSHRITTVTKHSWERGNWKTVRS